MLSNTATAENQPVTFANFPVENRHDDPFTVRDGRYVGHDGFVVPKNFDEFDQRFPHYVRHWVSKHAEKSAQPEDVEDWTQDLLIHMKYLPPSSKYRKAGREDIVQTFDPSRHHGANVRRFLNYINLCVGNKFRTMQSARMKNPLCRLANLSLSVQRDAENSGQVDDEYCHAHSEYLRKASEQLEKQAEDRHRITEFTDFVSREDSGVVPAIGAILATNTKTDAARFLRTTDYGFTQMRTRLLQLGKCFENGEPVPRQRDPYKKRVKTRIASNILVENRRSQNVRLLVQRCVVRAVNVKERNNPENSSRGRSLLLTHTEVPPFAVPIPM
jgi:hypothetical protein